MARNIYPGYCYCCGEYIEPGYGHFERNNGKWRIKCVKCASGRNLTDNDNGVLWAQQEAKRVNYHAQQQFSELLYGRGL